MAKDKILKDDDKLMRGVLSQEMLKKIEKRVDNHDDGAFKTIKEFLSDDTKKAETPKPQKKK